MKFNSKYKYPALMNYFRVCLILMISILILHGCKSDTEPQYFQIRVVDESTNRGVPLVCLISMTRNQYWTDSNGYIAFYEPGMMNQEVYFTVKSDGYEIPVRLDGHRAVVLHTVPGESTQISIKRNQAA